MTGVSTGENSLLGVARWIEALLHSQAVTFIAVLAIAGVGFSLLTGRMAVRRAASVALGCFLLFGASTIARGLIGVASNAGSQAPVVLESPPAPTPVEAPPPQLNVVADPYAGATVAG